MPVGALALTLAAVSVTLPAGVFSSSYNNALGRESDWMLGDWRREATNTVLSG